MSSYWGLDSEGVKREAYREAKPYIDHLKSRYAKKLVRRWRKDVAAFEKKWKNRPNYPYKGLLERKPGEPKEDWIERKVLEHTVHSLPLDYQIQGGKYQYNDPLDKTVYPRMNEEEAPPHRTPLRRRETEKVPLEKVSRWGRST